MMTVKTIPPARPRGRPRKVDRNELVARLRRTFLLRGYSGASIERLARSAGVERASLYRFFGGKRAMYLAAYERTAGELTSALAEAISDARIDCALARFFEAARRFFTGDNGHGCFAIGTALTEAPTETSIREALQASIRQADALLERRFRKAVNDGQLGPHERPDQLAIMASTALHGLAVRVRAGLTEKELHAFVDAALAVMLAGKQQQAPRVGGENPCR